MRSSPWNFCDFETFYTTISQLYIKNKHFAEKTEKPRNLIFNHKWNPVLLFEKMKHFDPFWHWIVTVPDFLHHIALVSNLKMDQHIAVCWDFCVDDELLNPLCDYLLPRNRWYNPIMVLLAAEKSCGHPNVSNETHRAHCWIVIKDNDRSVSQWNILENIFYKFLSNLGPFWVHFESILGRF